MSKEWIRALQRSDDFDRIHALVHQYFQMLRNDQQNRYVSKPDDLRNQFFGKEMAGVATKGFVCVKDEQIVAFAGVYLAHSKNGLLVAGLENGYEADLGDLIDQCADVVRENKGERISRFITLNPGQIRNDEVTFWEKFGFVADPYFHALIKCEVDEWQVPEHLDTSWIQPASSHEIAKIISILREDHQDYLAEEFEHNYESTTPDHVFLTMKDGENHVQAIAYYQVKRFKDKSKDGKVYDGLGAWNCGIHFRPVYALDQKQKRRFIQAVISSMKQLNVIFASGRISSRDYDCFIELLAEGFYFQGNSGVQNRMCRQV